MSREHTAMALDLIDLGRNTVMDCRTQPLSDRVLALDADDARRLVLALAMIGGTLAALLPDATRAHALAAYTNEETK